MFFNILKNNKKIIAIFVTNPAINPAIDNAEEADVYVLFDTELRGGESDYKRVYRIVKPWHDALMRDLHNSCYYFEPKIFNIASRQDMKHVIDDYFCIYINDNQKYIKLIYRAQDIYSSYIRWLESGDMIT